MGDSKEASGAASHAPAMATVHQDNMSLQIAPEKLDGSNFSTWSQSVELYVTSKGKLSCLTGRKTKPEEKDAVAYATWVEENAMVKSWLLNSMTSGIRAVFLRLPTAHDIWEAVSQTFFVGKDASQIYELRCRAYETRQNSKSLTEYYAALQLIWQELDHLRPCAMQCTTDASTMKKQVEEDRLYDFLAGLDPNLDHIRSQVLAQDPLPSIKNAFAFVRREELRQLTMMAGNLGDGSAMVASRGPPRISPNHGKSTTTPRYSSNSFESKNSDTRHCTHCNGTKHTRETCFKLH